MWLCFDCAPCVLPVLVMHWINICRTVKQLSGSRQDRHTLLKLCNGSSWACTFRTVSARVPCTAFNVRVYSTCTSVRSTAKGRCRWFSDSMFLNVKLLIRGGHFIIETESCAIVASLRTLVAPSLRSSHRRLGTWGF